jgi:nicotinate-nucleotide adenylyltransferase
VDTLRALKSRDPGTELVLLVGADAAGELSDWHEASEIPRLARIATFARAGKPAPAGPGIWRTLAVPAIDISATDVRERVRTGKPIRWWVPETVARYVAVEGLYLDGV